MTKPIVSLVLTMLMGFVFFQAKANSGIELNEYTIVIVDTLSVKDSVIIQEITSNDSIGRIAKPEGGMQKKRFVSAVLALPFPFGFLGAHRVMLGCKPWVPVVYVATFGGCFGLLPLIDFCVLVFSKDITQYENNPNIFMWLK